MFIQLADGVKERVKASGCRVLCARCWVLCRVLGAGCWVLCRVRGAGCGAWVRGAAGWCRVRGIPVAQPLVVAGVNRYQDLVAWQLANELKKKIYVLVDSTSARDDHRFAEQIKDSAASAPRNLSEGFGCYRHPEFARYTRI